MCFGYQLKTLIQQVFDQIYRQLIKNVIETVAYPKVEIKAR